MADRRTGDTLPPLVEVTGTNLNTVGTTTLIHVKRPDGTLITRSPVVATGTTGAWTLAFLPGELDLTGVYQYEAETTDAGGKVQTFRYGGFRVEAQLDGATPTFIPPLILDGGVL